MPRTACWAVLLALLASPAARAMELRKHTIPPNLVPLFKELQQELDELRRQDRAAKRRIESLEDELREARSRLSRLEMKITMLKVSVGTLESALKRAETEAAPAPAAEPGKPPAPPVAGKEPAGPAEGEAKPPAKILSSSARIQGTYITVTGTVQNTSGEALTFLVVEAQFFGRGEEPIKTVSAFTEPRVIAPGDKAAFKVVTRHDPRIRSHKLLVRTE